MTYAIQNLIGAQPIANTSTVQAHKLGTIVRAVDPIYGEGEFIYLKGVASTVLGDVVAYVVSDGATNTGTTVRWDGGANSGKPVAIAMSANVASQYGWYQIGGAAVVNTSGTVTALDPANFAATATVKTAAVTGKMINGMVAGSANGVPATNQAVYTIDRPSVQATIA